MKCNQCANPINIAGQHLFIFTNAVFAQAATLQGVYNIEEKFFCSIKCLKMYLDKHLDDLGYGRAPSK